MMLGYLIRDLGVVGLSLQGVLALTLLLRRYWSRFPFFAAYVWLSFTVGIFAYPLQKSHVAYFYVYWLGEALGIGLGLFVVYEIFRHVFTVHKALLRLATLTFRIAAVALLSAGLIIFFVQSPNNVSNISTAVLAVEQAARVIEVGLLMILFICSAAFGLHWKQAEFGIALGLAFYATIELTAVTLRPLVGQHGSALLNVIKIVTLDCSFCMWLSYLLAPERVVSSAELPKQSQLEQWNQAVTELINR